MDRLIRAAVVGIGKMGLSHVSILRAHPDVDLRAICDSSGYVLDVLHKYTGIGVYTDVEAMLGAEQLDAVVIATPTGSHYELVMSALNRGLHVFCEKPLTLTSAQSLELAAVAERRGLVTQVGYHNRFVATFAEVKRLLDHGAVGRVTHVLAEAYGPVVLKERGTTWRSRRSEGGSCVYDYAAHPLDLLTWYFGPARAVSGTVLGEVFSVDTEDEVHGTILFDGSVSGQLSVNWSDESYRKMTTRVTVWGTGGRIFADRQECQVYLRSEAGLPEGYQAGWNVRYTTDLTPPVWFYVRGEEYSAQLDYFVRAVVSGSTEGAGTTFSQAAETDQLIEMMLEDAALGPRAAEQRPAPSEPRATRGRLGRIRSVRARARSRARGA